MYLSSAITISPASAAAPAGHRDPRAAARTGAASGVTAGAAELPEQVPRLRLASVPVTLCCASQGFRSPPSVGARRCGPLIREWSVPQYSAQNR